MQGRKESSSSRFYYYTWIYKACEFSNDTESEALSVGRVVVVVSILILNSLKFFIRATIQ